MKKKEISIIWLTWNFLHFTVDTSHDIMPSFTTIAPWCWMAHWTTIAFSVPILPQRQRLALKQKENKFVPGGVLVQLRGRRWSHQGAAHQGGLPCRLRARECVVQPVVGPIFFFFSRIFLAKLKHPLYSIHAPRDRVTWNSSHLFLNPFFSSVCLLMFTTLFFFFVSLLLYF